MESSHDCSDKLYARVCLLAAAMLAALVWPGAALATTQPTITVDKKFKVVAYFPNHTPIANKGWPITVDVTKGKTRLSGSVKYEFEYNGTVVSHQPGHTFKNGVYKDDLTFTSAGIGQPLTLVVEVTTKYGTEDVNWAVTTKK